MVGGSFGQLSVVGYFLGKWSVVGRAWSVVGGRWSVVLYHAFFDDRKQCLNEYN